MVTSRSVATFGKTFDGFLLFVASNLPARLIFILCLMKYMLLVSGLIWRGEKRNPAKIVGIIAAIAATLVLGFDSKPAGTSCIINSCGFQ